MITIDGSFGEGGGQILRSSLALSLVTGKALRIDNIRSGRSRPGLMRQHLTAVMAATDVGAAEVDGAEIGSQRIEFHPRSIRAGEFHLAVGTAGSATLVLQTVLPALLIADKPSSLVLEGGTHNPYAPPFDFLEKAFLPLIERMGPGAKAILERPGFYPAGGGRFRVELEPTAKLQGFELIDRGALVRCDARALVALLPRKIGERELSTLKKKLAQDNEGWRVEEVQGSRGPGNVLIVEVEHEHVIDVFTGFGERRVKSETVAERAAKQVKRYLAADVPVGLQLADQLLLPLSMAGSGKFRTVKPSRHTTTNIAVIQEFLDVTLSVEQVGEDVVEIEVKGSPCC